MESKENQNPLLEADLEEGELAYSFEEGEVLSQDGSKVFTQSIFSECVKSNTPFCFVVFSCLNV